MVKDRKLRPKKSSAVTLKAVAEHVGLTPGTVSAVLNNAPSSRSIPEHTKNRILVAARELNYRPNFFAQSLRKKRTYTIGVIVEEIGDAYGSLVISGIEQYLRQKNYFFLTVVHRHDPDLLDRYAQILQERGVEGFITVDMRLREAPSLPTVAVAGHTPFPGVTNIILDHHHAARVALQHLLELGHRNVAFMKGHAQSSDSEDRWKAIVRVSDELGIKINPALVIRLKGDKVTPDLGYMFARRFLARNHGPFTALFAYNDTSAIGAIRAIHEAGLQVPDDISVVGFDDIESAAYHNPAITTVRQPLQRMGEIAARTLLNQIESGEPRVPEITVEPEFVVRGSTSAARANRKAVALKLA